MNYTFLLICVNFMSNRANFDKNPIGAGAGDMGFGASRGWRLIPRQEFNAIFMGHEEVTGDPVRRT